MKNFYNLFSCEAKGLKLKMKALSKNLLFIVIGLFGLSLCANAQSIASGPLSNVSYFLCTSGVPMGCGSNYWGQLGPDAWFGSNVSTAPMNELSGITAISSGRYHSLFLKNDGSVWACGRNDDGQLGDGTSSTDTYPAFQISALSGINTIAAGGDHSLFLKNDGSVWACGKNTSGQLGDGTNEDRHTPIQVSELSGITAIAVGSSHSLFLKNDGSVWASGYNTNKQLGDGTTTSRNTPVQVNELSGITAIAAGPNFSLFLKNDGSVWACGKNDYGQLGDGTTAGGVYGGSHLAQVNDLTGVTAISAGSGHSLFLKNDGSVWACGGNSVGQLGDGTTEDKLTPLQVSGLSGITAIAAGSNHSLFQKNDGSVWACGSNGFGQLGDGTYVEERLTPVQVQIDTQCISVGIDDLNNHFSNLIVYPNPANNNIVIKIESASETGNQNEVKIYNAVGQEVLQSSANSYRANDLATIDISSLSSGVYFIRLFDGDNQSQGKFVKE